MVVAVTTAGGLRGALGEMGRTVVTVTGRDLGTPSVARSVVDVEIDPETGIPIVIDVADADVASPLTIENSPQALTGEAALPAATVAVPAPIVESVGAAETAVAGATVAAPVPLPETTTAAPKVINTTVVPKATTTTTIVIDIAARGKVAESVPDTAPPTTAAPTTTAQPTTTTVAPTTTARPTTTTTRAPTTTARPTTTTTRAPTTTTTQAPGTVRVSNGVANGGGFSNTPINDAINRASAGTRFEFSSGNHGTLKISGANGAQGNPIVLTAADSSNRPTFTDNSYTGRAGIELSGSSNITISNITIRKSMWGIRVEGSSGILIDNVRVDDIGQEGIRVMQRSSYVTIQNSTISNTGQRTGTAPDGQSYSLFGEGIYIGTGKDSSDEVHHIKVLKNDISNTKTEAIDVKQPAHNIEISNNNIHDIRTGTSGAVVVHIEKDYSASSPNIKISYNTIKNISTNSGFRDGVGIVVGSSADIIGNNIQNTEHYAIRVEDEGSQGSRITANIRDNRFSNVGRAGIWQSGNKAKLNTSNNSGS